MVFSEEDKILIKNLRQLKGYTAVRFLREFEYKNWTRSGLDYLLAKIDRKKKEKSTFCLLCAN